VNATSHRLTSLAAVELANQFFRRPLISRPAARSISQASVETDDFEDMEFVHVRAGRDDPHRGETDKLDDRSHTSSDRKRLTAFNHFIDIRKGPGEFDDYDGYSYFRGSAGRGEHQAARELTGGWAAFLANATGWKVDQGLAFWFNDEYPHAPGHPWYRRCSPALERYSFPGDLGRFAGREEEMAARFPLAASRGRKGLGFPYSVFMPVDNLARYWLDRFTRAKSSPWKFLGPALHAVQDVAVPHHAAGCNGNWHVDYEVELDRWCGAWLAEPGFHSETRVMLARWLGKAAEIPRCFRMAHLGLRPGKNWRIQDVVTWLALHAYDAYQRVYGSFRKGFKPDHDSMRNLLRLAAAASAWALVTAVRKSVRK